VPLALLTSSATAQTPTSRHANERDARTEPAHVLTKVAKRAYVEQPPGTSMIMLTKGERDALLAPSYGVAEPEIRSGVHIKGRPRAPRAAREEHRSRRPHPSVLTRRRGAPTTSAHRLSRWFIQADEGQHEEEALRSPPA
jgi:hypothetical protein